LDPTLTRTPRARRQIAGHFRAVRYHHTGNKQVRAAAQRSCGSSCGSLCGLACVVSTSDTGHDGHRLVIGRQSGKERIRRVPPAPGECRGPAGRSDCQPGSRHMLA